MLLPVKKLAPRDAAAMAELPDWTVYKPPVPGMAEAAMYFELAADADGRDASPLLRRGGRPRRQPEVQSPASCPASPSGKTARPTADGYVTGLEPGINFPNVKSFEQREGRVTVLAPGESRTYQVAVEVHGDAAGVKAAAAAVEGPPGRHHAGDSLRAGPGLVAAGVTASGGQTFSSADRWQAGMPALL